MIVPRGNFAPIPRFGMGIQPPTGSPFGAIGTFPGQRPSSLPFLPSSLLAPQQPPPMMPFPIEEEEEPLVPEAAIDAISPLLGALQGGTGGDSSANALAVQDRDISARGAADMLSSSAPLAGGQNSTLAQFADIGGDVAEGLGEVVSGAAALPFNLIDKVLYPLQLAMGQGAAHARFNRELEVATPSAKQLELEAMPEASLAMLRQRLEVENQPQDAVDKIMRIAEAQGYGTRIQQAADNPGSGNLLRDARMREGWSSLFAFPGERLQQELIERRRRLNPQIAQASRDALLEANYRESLAARESNDMAAAKLVRERAEGEGAELEVETARLRLPVAESQAEVDMRVLAAQARDPDSLTPKERLSLGVQQEELGLRAAELHNREQRLLHDIAVAGDPSTILKNTLASGDLDRIERGELTAKQQADKDEAAAKRQKELNAVAKTGAGYIKDKAWPALAQLLAANPDYDPTLVVFPNDFNKRKRLTTIEGVEDAFSKGQISLKKARFALEALVNGGVPEAERVITGEEAAASFLKMKGMRN